MFAENRSARLPLPLRLAGVVALVAVLGWLTRDAFLDDALIYARYIRNALSGMGLVFNSGEHVNALTSPLYSYLVLLVAKLTGGHVLGATAAVSTAALLFTSLLAEFEIPYAGLLIASTAFFYFQVGMETSLFLGFILLLAVLTERERYEWLPTVCALLLLTRFEGGIFLVALAWELRRRGKWPKPAAFVPVVVLLALYLGLNHFWYHAWLPASAGAKFGQGRSGLWGRWPRAFLGGAYQLKPFFLPEVEVVAAVGVLAAVAAWKIRGTAMQRILLPAVVLLFAFYVLANIPGYRWYFAPFIFFGFLLACAELDRLRYGSWIALALVAGSLAASAHIVRGLHRSGAPVDGYPAIAAWLMQNAPHTRLETGEIGTLGWDCPSCDVIDSLGLTDPKNASHIAHRDITSWLAEDRPDYVVVHFSPWAFEQVAKDSPDYERMPNNFGPVVYMLRRKHP